MLAPVTHITPITLIRRERMLPRPGKVLVRTGQKVGPLDPLAEAKGTPEYQWLDIPRLLGVSPAKSERLIQCQPGDQLAPGDVVAGPVGISNRVVRAQKESRVILVTDGQVLLELLDKPFQLLAGIPGDVVELIPDLGAVVETTGAWIQGVWGNGLVNFGLMTVLARRPDQPLVAGDLDMSLRGSVVFAGICRDAEALKLADELPLRGLILSSLSAELLPAAAKTRCPVVVLEGFGERPCNTTAYKLLTTNNHRETVVNGEPWYPYSGVRPEVVIPLPAPGRVGPAPETEIFAPRKVVRLLRPPHAGRVGEIINIKKQAVFPGGLRGKAAEVRLETDEVVMVPLANLECIN